VRIDKADWNDRVTCSLEHIALTDNNEPKFVALSYVWGDPDFTHCIMVNGHSFAVTANLYAALRHLRKVSSTIGFDAAEFPFWIDAICINQADVDEKSLQIPRMREIYSSASQVIAWLGENTVSDEEKVRFVFEAPVSSLSALPRDAHGIDEKSYRSALRFYSTSDTSHPPSYQFPDYIELKEFVFHFF
jgi:hypothetical protein